MCGIAGIINIDRMPLDRAILRSMCDRIVHRGPDDEGYVLFGNELKTYMRCRGNDTVPELVLPEMESVQGNFSAGFGFRRLSIIDLTAQGHQASRRKGDR